MARIKNTILGQLQGRIGDMVFRKYGNTTVAYLYEKPKPTSATVRQMQNRNSFKEAIAYAKKAMRDPVLKERYQQKARELGKGNAYNAAISDFLKRS